MEIIYTAIFVDRQDLKEKYEQVFPNSFYHHSTIEFKPNSLENIPVGEKVELKIIGRLTTDKVDVLLVDNPLSKNEYPHITLSTNDGVKPYESNSEIKNNLDKVKPINDSVRGIYGWFDGKDKRTDLNEMLNEVKNRFYKILENGK